MPLPRVQGERILALLVDPALPVPMYVQIFNAVRDALISGVLEPGARLPSTRALAADLGVSRNTVVMAYERLRHEGYARGRSGSDTRVAATIPERVMRPLPVVAKQTESGRSSIRISRTAMAVRRVWERTALRVDHVPRAFRSGLPATDLFPYAIWGRLLSRRWGKIGARDLGYGTPQGITALRTAIAGYVAAARGIRCRPEQLFVVAGAQAALSIAARLVLDPGESAWVEDPGYHGARAALAGVGAHVTAVPVDDEGLQVNEGVRLNRSARAAIVTPSRQLPLGVVMSAARRSSLLSWAQREDAWIIEDDYDSELRFATRPLPALFAENCGARVLYIGTFSKVLFPSLRLGYLIVPEELIDATAAVRQAHDMHSPSLEQLVLADFIAEGHFERHVRRVRQVYLERQQLLKGLLDQYLAGILRLPAGESGLFINAWLNGIPDEEAARAAAAGGVDVVPLSRLSTGQVAPALLLGYAGLNELDIRDGVTRLTAALEPLANLHRTRRGA